MSTHHKEDSEKNDNKDKDKKNAANKTQRVSDQFSAEVIEERLTPNPLSQFEMDKDTLRLALVTAQYALRATRQTEPPTSNKPTGLLVLVNGMEQAGKGTAVKQLRQWVDPRLLKVEATIGYPPLSSQPIWQAHTKALPRHGDVMVYFGNWYADLLYNVMRMATSNTGTNNPLEPSKAAQADAKQLAYAWQDYLRKQLAVLQSFERDLVTNQTKLLKCWFHVDAQTLQQRLNDDEADPDFLYQIDWDNAEVLTQFNDVAAELLRAQNDWVIIDGSDKSQAATHFCHEVMNAVQEALVSSQTQSHDADKEEQGKTDKKSATPHIDARNIGSRIDNSHAVVAAKLAAFKPTDIPDELQRINSDKIKKAEYKKALADKQTTLAKLIRARSNQHIIFAFEGMDAAGKGGAIKRMVAPLDPREYQIYNIGAPMRHELQHPYLWRFWTRLPNEQTDRISRVAIFDRTWYGRVLVERVEHLATDGEWQRAYDEINRFETDLVNAGTLVVKYWLVIDKDEQLKRFEARQETPHKQFKLTDDDWRNRERWSDYVQAAADMLARTDTTAAPWCVIATNEKRQARLAVLDHAIAQLSTLGHK